MVTQNVTVGSFAFTAVSSLKRRRMRAATAMKLLGVNRSQISTWGSWGGCVYIFDAVVTGVSSRTDLASILTELDKPRPIPFLADILNGVTAYGYLLVSEESTAPGLEIADICYTYILHCIFLEGTNSNDASPGLMYGVVQENDTFSATGDIVVPGPVGATTPSETADFTRSADDGAAGTNAISCFLNPDLTKITYAATEANLAKNLVAVTGPTSPAKEYTISNGMVKLTTRHDEAGTKGYVELYYYNGTAWVDLGRIRASVMKSASTLQEITASSKGPDVWVIPGGGHPERAALRMLYPATTTDALTATLNLQIERGKPFVKATLENSCATPLVKCDYRIDLTPTTFRYWTHDSTEEDATSGAHGTPDTVAGDAETVNASWVHTTTGTPAVATILCGYARKKKADCDHLADDAVDYWDYLSEEFDNVTINYGQSFEPVWIFAGKYDKVGSRTAAQLASEALARVTMHQTIIPKV